MNTTQINFYYDRTETATETVIKFKRRYFGTLLIWCVLVLGILYYGFSLIHQRVFFSGLGLVSTYFIFTHFYHRSLKAEVDAADRDGRLTRDNETYIIRKGQTP